MSIDYSARLNKLLAAVQTDVVAFVPGANMEYFTGLHLHLSERPTIAFYSEEGLSFIMPQLEMVKLVERPDLEAQAFAWSDADGYADAFSQAAQALELDHVSLGVDGQTMRVFEFMALAAGGAKMEDAQEIGQTMRNVRAIKSADEIAALREAIAISEEALKRTLDWAQPGMTEQQIAAKLSDELSALGTDGHAFGPSVLTGPKSALPHGGTGSREWGDDEFLLIDFGGIKRGYPADITRTFCKGTPSDEMRKIYDAVLAANRAALAIAKPGVTCHEVDKAARDVIAAAGYGEYFTHRTGHGLGLEVHELPNIATNNHRKLEAGMVFTIEPGIYVPQVGGVRIEDDVLVTEDGCESLTTYPREL